MTHQIDPPCILIAPNAFKGTLSAVQAAEFMHDALKSAFPMACLNACPMADGGDGTLAVLRHADNAFMLASVEATGPLADMRRSAEYLYHPERKLAVLEAAQAHGLVHLGSLAPMEATSYGVGELMNRVRMRHPDLKTLIVTLGGSASTDGGLGALQALGVSFFDSAGDLLVRPFGGRDLACIHSVEWPDWEAWPEVWVATDVINPLLGPTGTARVFAPQKGATPAQCDALEAGLRHIAKLFAKTSEQHVDDEPGTGAAGGLGFGLRQLPNSRIVSGFDWLAEFLGLPQKVRAASVILTGEGRLDATSLSGKGVGSLIRLAEGRPVFVLCGDADPDLCLPDQVRVFSMASAMGSVEAAMAAPKAALALLMREVILELARRV